MAVAEVVVGGILSAIVERTIDKSLAYLGGDYDLPHGADKLLSKLQTSLTMVKAITEEADNRLITNASLIKWLRLLHEAAYEAEDVLDDFDVRERTVTGGKRKVSELVSSSCSTIKRWFVPDSDMSRLEDVACKLDQLCAGAGALVELMKWNVSDSSNSGIISREKGETSSHLPVDVVVFGRDEVRELILKMILDSSDVGEEEPNPSSRSRGKTMARYRVGGIDVLPVVGMSGVGKTTLAQVIYNHERVQLHFGQRAWVYVSEHFTLKRTMQEILHSLGGGDMAAFDPIKSLEAIINKIRAVIQPDQKFLLVLDNVWDELCDQWNILLTALVHDVPGSIILVTTQSRKVADAIGTIGPIPLNVLQWESFWPLFQHYALGNMVEIEEEKKRNLLLIGQEIAGKLDGLPLAAKVIGNLLRSMLDEGKWRRVSESDWWNLSEAVQGILLYLGVSYQHLKPRQRQCFAYCSIFPKNYLFDKDRLVQMWIAHDFIQCSDDMGMRLEDVAMQWFDELVQRSFFQTTWDNKRYIMNDLMRGLAIAVSAHECLLLRDSSREVLPSIRHIALQIDRLSMLPELSKCKNLRTILLFGDHESDRICNFLDSIFYMSSSLRVLDLSFVHVTRNEVAKSIRFLKKLRFLDLSHTGIDKLREFPCENQNLQVICLRGYSHGSLPQEITKLSNLRHLYADAKVLSSVSGIGKLTALQELDNFSARKKEGYKVTELKYMQEITGQLCISNADNVQNKEEAMEANLMGKKHLSSLVLRGKAMSKEVLEGFHPPVTLKELTIEGYRGKELPHWMVQTDGFACLSSIHISSCRFLELLPPFGHLPTLKFLALDRLPSIKCVGDYQFYGYSDVGFPSLQELRVSSMEAWEEWFCKEAMRLCPQLKILQLVYCSALREVPSLSSMLSLSELEISECGDYINVLPSCTQVLTCLTNLKLSYCSHQVSLRSCHLKSLENLTLVSCEGLRLVGGLRPLTNLRKVRVMSCPRLFSTEVADQEQPQENQGLNHLTHLISDESLVPQDCFPILGRLPSLRYMQIYCSSIVRFSVQQEAWFQHLTSLEALEILNCYQLENLPATLATLPSIKKLTVLHSTKIHSLPERGMPPGLQELHLSGGPLSQRCSREEQGAEWPKIAHVPYIRVENRTIQNLSEDAASTSGRSHG